MTEQNQTPETTLLFSGSPSDIGLQIWMQLCAPVVDQASHTMPKSGLIQLYASFTVAAWGAMVADFGHENAIALARQILAAFEKYAPTLHKQPPTH